MPGERTCQQGGHHDQTLHRSPTPDRISSMQGCLIEFMNGPE